MEGIQRAPNLILAVVVVKCVQGIFEEVPPRWDSQKMSRDPPTKRGRRELKAERRVYAKVWR